MRLLRPGERLYKVHLSVPDQPGMSFWVRHIPATCAEEAITKAQRQYPATTYHQVLFDDSPV